MCRGVRIFFQRKLVIYVQQNCQTSVNGVPLNKVKYIHELVYNKAYFM